MFNWDDFQGWSTKLAGFVGAFVSMRFVKGTVWERLTMAVGGAFFSLYATDIVASKLALPEGLTGFLCGLFGMSILARAWEWLQTTNFINWLINALINIGGGPKGGGK